MPVVEGEDSESDVDQEIEPEAPEVVGGTMVSGEAPETDEEDEPSEPEAVPTSSQRTQSTPRGSTEGIRERIKSFAGRGRKTSSEGTRRRVHRDPRYDS